MPDSAVPALVFDSLPVAAVLLELDGRVIAVNAAACRIAGRTAAELVGRSAAELQPGIADLLDSSRRRGELVHELQLDTPSGRRALECVMSTTELDGRSILQVFGIDVSARKQAEELARARIDADEQHAAKQRLESLGLVAGGIAHDFNNLLVGVLAEASAAREDRALTENTREALRRIEASARRMAQLTRQLLAFAGRGQFVTVPVDADGLLGELRESLARLVRHDAKLQITPTASAVVVEADPALLRQVVSNLVANASDSGGRSVEVTSRVILRETQPWWELEVSDDGSGIDAATLPRIFEPFFSTKQDRHGLGLSAVHGIIRRLGGDIEVDSQLGRGSRFRVRLPIVPGAEPVRRAVTEALGIPALKLAGIRVLVADDEPSVRATVRRLLERRGATVVVAADGFEAEARLRDEQFGLVVLDVAMPGRTGHDVLPIARATQPAVPVILMSGYTEKIRGEGSEEEADAFIEKPFTAKSLDQTIDEVMKGKR